MRQEVKDLAQGVAEEQLFSLEYLTVLEFAEGAGVEINEEEASWVCGAVTQATVHLYEENRG